jgi:hypothetical protein
LLRLVGLSGNHITNGLIKGMDLRKKISYKPKRLARAVLPAEGIDRQ